MNESNKKSYFIKQLLIGAISTFIIVYIAILFLITVIEPGTLIFIGFNRNIFLIDLEKFDTGGFVFTYGIMGYFLPILGGILNVLLGFLINRLITNKSRKVGDTNENS